MKLKNGLKMFAVCMIYSCVRDWLYKDWNTAKYSYHFHKNYSYKDAVEEIIGNIDDDFYRNSALDLLIDDADGNYYDGIIAIATSEMDDFYKIRAIEVLSKKVK